MPAPTPRAGQRSSLARQGTLFVTGNASTVTLAAEPRRLSATVVNTSAVPVYVGYRPETQSSEALIIEAGGSFYDEQFTGALYLYVASGTVAIPYVEVYF